MQGAMEGNEYHWTTLNKYNDELVDDLFAVSEYISSSHLANR